MDFFGFKKNDDDVKTDAQDSLPGTETTIDRTAADKAIPNDADDIKHDDSDGDIKKPSTDEPALGVFSALEQAVEKLTDGPTTTTETDQEEELWDGQNSTHSDPYSIYYCDDTSFMTLEKLDRHLHTAAGAMFPHAAAPKATIWALIIYWDSQEFIGGSLADLKEHLEPVFREKCGYITDTFKIPQDNPEQALVERLAEFVQLGGDSPDDLKIVYYAGYARDVNPFEQVWTTDTRAGQPNEAARKAKRSEVRLSAVQAPFKHCNSDILYLLDCRFSRSIYPGCGKRVTEYLVSDEFYPFGRDESGQSYYSFTKAVADALDSLCAQVESGETMPLFTVGTLSTTIYHLLRQNQPAEKELVLEHTYRNRGEAENQSIQLQRCDVPTHKTWRPFYLTSDMVQQLFTSAPKVVTMVDLIHPVPNLVSLPIYPFKVLQSGFQALTKHIQVDAVYQRDRGRTVLTLCMPKVLFTYLPILLHTDQETLSGNLLSNNVHSRDRVPGYDRADGDILYKPALWAKYPQSMAQHLAWHTRSMEQHMARRIRENEDRYRDLNRRLNRVFKAIKAHASSPFGLVVELEGDDGDDSTTGSISGDGSSDGANRGTDDGSSSDGSTTEMEIPGLLREWLSSNQQSHDGSPPTVESIDFWRQLTLCASNSSQSSSEADRELPGILKSWLMDYDMKRVLRRTRTTNVEVPVLLDWLRLYEGFNRNRRRVFYEWAVSGSDYSEDSEVSTVSDSARLDHLVKLSVDFAVRVDPRHREEVELAANLDKFIKAIYMLDAEVNEFMDEIMLPSDAEDDNNSRTSSCDHTTERSS